MNTCPNCSYNLLSQLRSRNRYWYCQHCRSETSDIFVSIKNEPTLYKSFLVNADRSPLFASSSSI